LLDAALNALRTLNVKDFVIMKSFNTPPAPIKLALEAACIMLGITPKYIEGPVDKATKKPIKIADFWDKSKKLLNDYKKFLSSLENYDKDFIPDDRIHKI
jgi:dynein heavy chain, axonemal